MSLHPALPQTFTAENLAKWITENNAEKREHKEELELTDEAKQEIEKKLSLAACKIQELQEVEKEFKKYLNGGTEVDLNISVNPEQEPQRIPKDITIPPTKGMKELKANVEFYSRQLRDGHTTETTDIYLIPFPEQFIMVGVDIEGKEWPDYTRDMTNLEKEVHDKPILREEKKKKSKASKKDFLEDEDAA